MPDPLDLDHLSALIEAAPPGPWRLAQSKGAGDGHYARILGVRDGSPVEITDYTHLGSQEQLDAHEAIVALRNAAPAMITLLRAYRTRDEAHAQMDACREETEYPENDERREEIRARFHAHAKVAAAASETLKAHGEFVCDDMERKRHAEMHREAEAQAAELRQLREREEQRRSFAYGNLGASREAIDRAAERVDAERAEVAALREVAEAARAWDRAIEGDGRPDVARRDARRALDRLDAVRGSR